MTDDQTGQMTLWDIPPRRPWPHVAYAVAVWSVAYASLLTLAARLSRRRPASP